MHFVFEPQYKSTINYKLSILGYFLFWKTYNCPVPYPSQYPTLACSGVTGERKADAPVSCCLSLAPSVSDRTSICLCGRPRPTTATQALRPHPLVSVFLSVPCLFTVSVCPSACLSCLLEPVTGPSSLWDRLCFFWASARLGERSAVKIQLGLFTKPHCSHA